MSAECHKHGCDIVYPPGSWPTGVCEVCEVEAKLDRYYKVIEDIYVEELNGVLCTPPYKSYETDAFGPDSFPDYDALVQRNYCASCRSIWRRVRDIVREHDEAKDAA